MCFDCILANSPYGKPGVDITKYIMENFPDANYAMLNTRSAFKKYYDKLACAFVQIGKYELGTNKKLDWGVEQAILLATNGWTEVIYNRKKKGDNTVQMSPGCRGFQSGHTSHLVGISIQTTSTASVINKDSFLTETDKDVPPSTCNGKRDYNLRSGYLYVSFETFEEACECAIDIISWTNPTDSHYRCVKWGFVCGLIPHYKVEKSKDLW